MLDATSYRFSEATAPVYRRPGQIVAVNGRPVGARPARDPIATTGRDDDDLDEGEDLEADDEPEADDADSEDDDEAEAAAAPEGRPEGRETSGGLVGHLRSADDEAGTVPVNGTSLYPRRDLPARVMPRPEQWVPPRQPLRDAAYDFGRFGAVEPTVEERATTFRAEVYVRSTPGGRLPLVRYFYVEHLCDERGAPADGLTDHYPVHQPPIPVLLRAGLDRERLFEVVIHELQHARDVYGLPLEPKPRAVLEARAEAAVVQARRERWRW